MDKWKWQKYDGIKYINIPQWVEMGVDTLFTSREGGFSEGEFWSLNMALHVGDNKVEVIQNRSKVLKVLDSTLDDMVCCEQVHGAKVAIIDKDNISKGAYDFASAIKGTDAMVTNIPKICLTTFYADCFPIYIFDPIQRVVGLAHSGWKGTMERIGAQTIKVMQENFSSNINDLQIFIGPGIHQCCFEINDELGHMVKNKFSEYNNILVPFKKGFLWDLPNTNRQVMLNLGVKEDHIIMSGLCTCCDADNFFSYRREKGKTGRMAALIRLRY